MTAVLGRLIRGDEGQDLLEYGMLVCLIAVATLLMLGSVGSGTNVFWQFIVTNVSASL